MYFVYTDHLDTPRFITRSPDGQTVWRWGNGDPFGLLPPDDNPAGLGIFTFNLRMPGQYYDKSTNLFYNYFRDYDPQLGRYVQSDPIGLDGGIGTYNYVKSNPAGLTDPFGMAPRRLDPSSQECRDLNEKIKRKSDLIAKLGREMYEDKQRLPIYPWIPNLSEKWSRSGHAERLEREIGNRDRDVEKYNDKCGPPPPAPSPVCAENCKRILKTTTDAITGAILFVFVLVCATS